MRWFLLISLLVATLYSAGQLYSLDIKIQDQFRQKKFAAPTRYYAQARGFSTKQEVDGSSVLIQAFLDNGYRQRPWQRTLLKKDVAWTQGETCKTIHPEANFCLAFHHEEEGRLYLVLTDLDNRILSITSTDSGNGPSSGQKTHNQFSFSNELFAQYVGSSPILQSPLSLKTVPRLCLDSVLAVEDPRFLDHQGVSWRGLARAFWINLKSMRYAQGGSTITQQLVKNYFLSSERKLSRKVKELIIAMILDARIGKDQILETYLNIIYWGQRGSYQIRGMHSASQYYFQKPVGQLALDECALLAAILNNPGRYNPFRHPERALKRRDFVLKKMMDQERILVTDYESALTAPLPQSPPKDLRETAPYFIQGVNRELRDLGFSDLSGYEVITTLQMDAQKQAQVAVQKQLKSLEEDSEYHKKNKEHSLEGVLVVSDSRDGSVSAVVGGRNFRKTPLNRALQSSRQVGSLFKPIVYLTALITDPDFKATSPLSNKAFTHKYGRQSWSPKNYDKTYSEKVPAFFALKESMNVPTASLALEVGLQPIITTARDLGVTSTLKEFPSLSLGAFELKPIEVLQAYTTLARLGQYQKLFWVRSVRTQEGEPIYVHEPSTKSRIYPQRVATLLSWLTETQRSGTAVRLKNWNLGFEVASKTGTTSNYRDAWFAGIAPDFVAIAWLGYDDGTPLKLAGSQGAMPMWADFAKSRQSKTPRFFSWPFEPLEQEVLTKEAMLSLGVPEKKAISTSLKTY